MKFLKDLLTEDDNISFCFARVASTLGILSYLANAGWIVYTTKTLLLTDFATGFSTLLVGAAAVIAGKQITTKSDK